MFSSRLGRSSEDPRQAPGVVHSQDVDVVFAAEGLDQSEVDLQCHVLCIVVIVCGEDAKLYVIRVPVRKKRNITNQILIGIVTWFVASLEKREFAYTFIDFAASYTPTVTQPWSNADASTSSRALDTESILEQQRMQSENNIVVQLLQ